MKRRLTRNVILMAIVTLIMGIGLSLYIASTGTVPAADNAASYTDGTYTASAHGCLSDVAVTVTITGGKVTDVDIDASGETPELGGNRGHHDQRCCLYRHGRLPEPGTVSAQKSLRAFSRRDFSVVPDGVIC